MTSWGSGGPLGQSFRGVRVFGGNTNRVCRWKLDDWHTSEWNGGTHTAGGAGTSCWRWRVGWRAHEVGNRWAYNCPPLGRITFHVPGKVKPSLCNNQGSLQVGERIFNIADGADNATKKNRAGWNALFTQASHFGGDRKQYQLKKDTLD